VVCDIGVVSLVRIKHLAITDPISELVDKEELSSGK
jgi:hypothetical protein